MTEQNGGETMEQEYHDGASSDHATNDSGDSCLSPAVPMRQSEEPSNEADAALRASDATEQSSREMGERKNDAQDAEEDDHDETCPICMHHTDRDGLQFLRGPCGHAFCRPCLEQLLFHATGSAGASRAALQRQHQQYAAYLADTDGDGEDEDDRADGNNLESGNIDSENRSRVLTAPRETPTSTQARANTPTPVSLIVPTLNVCPICRAKLDLFELKVVRTIAENTDGEEEDGNNDYAYQKDYDWVTACPQLANAIYVDTSSTALLNASSSSSSSRQRQQQRQSQEGIGFGSFHFVVPADLAQQSTGDTVGAKPTVVSAATDGAGRERERTGGDDTMGKPDTAPHAYFNVENVPYRRAEYDEHLKISDVHYHAPTRTVRGGIRFERGVFETWNVYASFSSDMSFVRAGLVHKIRRRSNLSEIDIRKMYPFDGRWKIKNDIENDAGYYYINVIGNACMLRVDDAMVFCFLSMQKEKSQMLIIPAAAASAAAIQGIDENLEHQQQTAVTTWDWTNEPAGPAVGTILGWKTAAPAPSSPNSTSTMYWKRCSISTDIPPDEIQYIGGSDAESISSGAGGRTYRRIIERSHFSRPRYNPNSVWGNVFCQAFKVGLASYHFVPSSSQASAYTANEVGQNDSNQGVGGTVYISYEHIATSQWPPLDNGMPVPNRVYFRRVSFPDRYTFRGEIHWQGDYNTTWQRMTKWIYEIKFDTKYTCIVGGQVLSCSIYDDVGNDTTGTEPTARELSRYGETLVYINAALYDDFVQMLLGRSTNSPGRGENQSFSVPPPPQHQQGDFAGISEELRSRLQSEGASVRTMAAVHRVLSSARAAMLRMHVHQHAANSRNADEAFDQDEDNPIDLNL